jgi:hypothetical protein
MKTTWNLALAGAIVASTVAFAAGSLDLWTDVDDVRYVYTDESFSGNAQKTATIEPVFLPGGSNTENKYRLQMTVVSLGGSRPETTRYVSEVPVSAELPATGTVYAANANWQRSGNALGNLNLTKGDRESMEGTLLNGELVAPAVVVE